MFGQAGRVGSFCPFVLLVFERIFQGDSYYCVFFFFASTYRRELFLGFFLTWCLLLCVGQIVMVTGFCLRHCTGTGLLYSLLYCISPWVVGLVRWISSHLVLQHCSVCSWAPFTWPRCSVGVNQNVLRWTGYLSCWPMLLCCASLVWLPRL